MSHETVQLNRKALSCSICLNLLKDPVTTSCGHNYCMVCIKTLWDGEDERGIYSCPQCRETFIPRPRVMKNALLAGLLEQLKETGLQAAPAGPEDVSCDDCSGRKLKAIKYCLDCPASYCEKHLQHHYNSATLQKHQLVDPSKKHQYICSAHDEVMDKFCRTDQKFICSLCSVEEHKGHDTVSAAAEGAVRQRELQVRQVTIQQEIQDREKNVKLLQQGVEDRGKIFTELIRLFKEQIRSKKETEVSRFKELQKKLDQEITELKRKDAELEQLSLTEDPIQLLLNCPSVSALSESPHSSRIKIRPVRYFENVTEAVEELRDKLQDVLRETWTNISLTVSEVDRLLSEPESRSEFLEYFCEITLDPNTANIYLTLSEENRKATVISRGQSYPKHPDRFRGCYQALSKESLTDRCYWEVELRGGVTVAVAYKKISRKGEECRFGLNDKSWALTCSLNRFTFIHNKIETSFSGPCLSRIGVYLDHRAGVLSFYRVSETMTLLHRVQTTFTQPLQAGVRLYFPGDSAEFCKLR